MARTKEELKEAIIANKRTDLFRTANWGLLISTINAFTQEEKDEIIEAIVENNFVQVGSMIATKLNDTLSTTFSTEVDTILADDTITLEELDIILANIIEV